MTYRNYTQEATSDALAWTLSEADSFNVVRIDIMFDAAPTTPENMTVTVDSVSGAAYDRVVQTIDPAGLTVVKLNPIVGLVVGDKIVVEYTNTDGRTITGSATLDVRPLTERGGMLFGNGIVRAPASNYRRYYHIPIGALNRGQGATWVNGDVEDGKLPGWQQDAATEYLWADVDIHDDWDAISNPVIEVKFCVNAAGTDAAHTVDFALVAFYGFTGVAAVKTQTVSESTVIGVCDQYVRFTQEFELDRTVAGNTLQSGQILGLRLACLATGDVTSVTVSHMSFSYKTTHVGIESGDE
jgi:hypothetical protein